MSLNRVITLASYLAFLLYIMPVARKGILITFLLFVIGSVWIVRKIPYEKRQTVRDNVLCGIFSAAFVIVMGMWFVNRWLTSYAVRMIAGRLNLEIQTLVLMAAVCLGICSSYFVFCVLRSVPNRITALIPKKYGFVFSVASCLLASGITVSLSQIAIEVEIMTMGPINFMMEILLVFVAIAWCCGITGRIKGSVVFVTMLFMVISTINAYVYEFRTRLFELNDIFSAATAMGVVSNYNLLPIPEAVVKCWIALLIFYAILFVLGKNVENRVHGKRRRTLLVCCVMGSLCVACYVGTLETRHWNNDGAVYNGYLLEFAARSKEVFVEKPEGYSSARIQELSDQYGQGGKDTENEKEPAHIIVIMDEAFADLSVVGSFDTDKEVTPFISSLKENAISGYALASVYGGNTANSEYEFLTGNSMAWLSPNAVPYQQYVKPLAYSMVSYLKTNYNYRCLAMHPYYGSGWNRTNVYEYLGFDECRFVEDFPGNNLVRSFISDMEMFEELTRVYEENRDSPLFIFGITMQNHGGYTYEGENYHKTISLTDRDNAYPDVEQYLSLLHETDKAVEFLISYFSEVEENVVIVFFGDHLPWLAEAFYNEIEAKGLDPMEQRQNRYKVPFFIWSNHNREASHISCTSLNYLSTYVYEAAGIALPAYNRFLSEMEAVIPAINANGYYSNAECRYLSFDEAVGSEQEWLRRYEMLQYNSIFDIKNKDKLFFPGV